ncbi:Cyclin Y [Balamuthia mandrillaris]
MRVPLICVLLCVGSQLRHAFHVDGVRAIFVQFFMGNLVNIFAGHLRGIRPSLPFTRLEGEKDLHFALLPLLPPLSKYPALHFLGCSTHIYFRKKTYTERGGGERLHPREREKTKGSAQTALCLSLRCCFFLRRAGPQPQNQKVKVGEPWSKYKRGEEEAAERAAASSVAEGSSGEEKEKGEEDEGKGRPHSRSKVKKKSVAAVAAIKTRSRRGSQQDRELLNREQEEKEEREQRNIIYRLVEEAWMSSSSNKQMSKMGGSSSSSSSASPGGKKKKSSSTQNLLNNNNHQTPLTYSESDEGYNSESYSGSEERERRSLPPTWSDDSDDSDTSEEEEEDEDGSSEEEEEEEDGKARENGDDVDLGWSDDEDEGSNAPDPNAEEMKKALTSPRAPPDGKGTEPTHHILFKKINLTEKKGRYPADLRKKALPRHMREEQGNFRRHKSNSTSSLYVNSTISAPDLNQVLWCMASALYYHVSNGHQTRDPVFFNIFNEEKHPITKGPVDTKSIPRVKELYKFLSTIFKAERLPSECAILCLAYIERLISATGVTLHASNWRRIILSSLILASKVWEDQAVWNVDFLSVFPNVDVNDLNKLEKYFLELVGYNVSLKASEYAKYYFELRELAEKDSKHFPLEPLTTQGAARLEERAKETEQRVKSTLKLKRTSSAGSLPIKSPPAVIN